MKFLTLSLVFILSSCAAYETLKTPVDFITGSETERVLKQDEMDKYYNERTGGIPGDSYEITVNAPQGTVINSAMDMFHREARDLCGSDNYKHEITSRGTTEQIEYQRQGQKTIRIPTVTGKVTCYK